MEGAAVVLSVWSQNFYVIGNFYQELLLPLWLLVSGQLIGEALA